MEEQPATEVVETSEGSMHERPLKSARDGHEESIETREEEEKGETVGDDADEDAPTESSVDGAVEETKSANEVEEKIDVQTEVPKQESGPTIATAEEPPGIEESSTEATIDKEEETEDQYEPKVAPEETNEELISQDQSPLKALADDLDDEEEFEVIEKEEAPTVEKLSAYDLEMQKVGAEVIFPPTSTTCPGQWTNLQWLSYNRSVRFCDLCTRLTVGQKKWFAGNSTENFNTRKLVIYDEPNLILILRPPTDAKEVQTILDLGDVSVNPRNYLVAETVIDPVTCKLRLSPLTTPTSIESTAGGDSASPQRQTCFEVVTPTETVLLSALRAKEDKEVMRNSVGFLETKTMEFAVGNALYAAHCPVDQQKSSDISWKHQLVLGTLTSFVISGSQKQLEKAIAAAIARNSDGSSTVPTHVIDQMDESGRTALHYACARRSSAAVAALIGAGASASMPLPSEEGELLPIHLSAKSLDHMSLSSILSAPRRPDPNALDSGGRTAMYLAATEGVSNDDPMDLSKCLSVLEAWGVEMGSLLNPVSVLASQWKYRSLGPILGYRGYRYPLPTQGMSVGSYHLYPVHTALLALRTKIQAIGAQRLDHGFGGGDTLKSQLRGTLQVLFEHGFEPNERLEVVGSFEGQSDLMEHTGFTPLQILAAAALDAEQLSKSGAKISTSILSSVAGTLAGAADILVQCGARMNIDAPPMERLTRSPVSASAELDDSSRSFPGTDRQRLKIDSNKDLMDLLGGKERLEACRKMWLEDKVAAWTGKMMIHQDKALADSDAPGGSNDKSCAICWSSFGTIMNRKHKCRVSLKYVCDECSTKRIKEDGQCHRLSDGQFLLARAEVALQKADTLKEQQDTVKRRRDQLEETRLKRQEKEKADHSQRDTLFGGILDKATSLLAGEDDDAKDDLGSLQASLGQTRDALNQRGERLGTLSEKTEKLMDASQNFAKMAKELEKSQSGGLFW
jgi:hypothetical protein